MKKIIITLVSAVLLPLCALAQTFTVKGTVKDSKGEPIIGAVVMLDGSTTVASVTDIDGKFSIAVPDAKKSALKVSCISYKEIKEAVSGRAVINFVMQDDTQQLDEVVVVGYGAMRRSDLTGSVSSVKISDDDAAKTASLDQVLMGRAAGVQVLNNSASPDAGVSVRVRGVTSLNGSSEPLYVVDGIIMSEAASGVSAGGDMGEETNSLLGLNPQDIASIEILKDASATAIYGADGANGVVLITTKQATKDKPVVRFNAGVDYNMPLKKIDMLSFDEYVQFLEMRPGTAGKTMLKKIYTDPETHTGLKVTGVNWQDYCMRNTLNQRYFFSISGRPKDLNYTLSLSYNNNNGIIKSTGLDVYTIRLNLDKNFSKKFKIGTKVNLAYVKSYSQQSANTNAVMASTSLLKSMINYRPFISGVDVDLEDIYDEEAAGEYKSGPDKWLKNAYATRLEYRITPSIYASYNFLKWLSFKSTLGGDFRMSENTKWKGSTVARSTGAVGSVSDAIKYRWSWDNVLTSNNKFGKHALTGTLGLTLGQDASESNAISGTNVSQEALQIGGLASSYKAEYVYSKSQNSRMSVFARAVYNYADRYVLTATYRLDGSSKFSRANRFSGFPSMAFAWRMNQEPWFHLNTISTLKFRVGWGQVGNSSVSSYQLFNMYSDNKYGNHFNDSGYIRGLYPSNFANPNLKWETTQQWNAGVDLSLWKGAVTLSLDAYDKTTYDLLQNRYVPYSSGYTSAWVNQGTINNRGLELSLELSPIRRRNVEWTVSGNISLNRNKLVDLGFDVDDTTIYLEKNVKSSLRYYTGSAVGGSIYMTDPANIFIEGYPIGLFYGYKTDGIVQNGETGIPLTADAKAEGEVLGPGRIKYVDLNGNGYVDKYDRTIIGDSNPDFTYGFSTSLKLWRFNISATFNGVYGNDILNANLAQETDPTWGTSVTNIRRETFYDFWTPTNPSNKTFKIDGWTDTERGYMTDRYLEDGSYLRLANLSIGYSIPMPKKFFIKGINVAASAGNLFVWTKYSGFSPMVNSFGRSMNRIGVDVGSYPLARSVSFDVKFTF